jgi:non-ribosomal peptide synthetase component F
MDTQNHAPFRWGSSSVSIAQHWLLQVARLNPTAPKHTTVALELIGELRLASLRAALDGLVFWHPILRTAFRYVNGAPESVVGPADRGLALWEQVVRDEDQVASMLKEESRIHFDVASGPLIRARLLEITTHHHFLLLSADPIICDRASLFIILRELRDQYENGKLERRAPPEEYAQFARRQFETLEPSALREQLSFWKKHLLGARDLVRLPTDRPRPANPTYTPRPHQFELSETLTRDLTKLAANCGVSLSAVLLCGWSVLLSRWSSQEDLTIGHVFAERPLDGCDGLIGPFENILPIRVAVSPTIGVTTLLARVEAALAAAVSRQDVPTHAICEALRPLRDGRPIIQAAISLNQTSVYALTGVPFHSGGITIGRVWEERCESTLEISMVLSQWGGRLFAVCEYAKELFEGSTIERVCHWWMALLKSMVDAPRASVARLTMLNHAERQCVVSEFNNGGWPLLEPQRIDAVFESQVELSPDAIAVLDGVKALSYLALNQRANQLAWTLRRRGMIAGDLVAVPAIPCVDSIVAVIAVLKAGGAYVPAATADLRGGASRSWRARGVRTCIVSSREGLVPWKGLEQVIVIDSDAAEISSASVENLERDDRTACDQACVLKSVNPKGRGEWMRLEHRNVTSMLASLDERLHFARFDAWSLAHSLSSSIALIELWGALLHGSQVTVAADPMRNAKALNDFLVHAGVTVLNLTPGEFLEWVEVSEPDRRYPLHTVILSGEPLRAATLRTWFDLGRRWPRLIYLRGHRQLAIASAWLTIKSTDASCVSRGMLGGEPLSCCRIYILDRYRQPVPIGVVGDIYVAGHGVVRGAGECRKSARRVPEPLDVHDSYSLWKTGDRGYWTAEGRFELLFSSDGGATADAEAVRIESELLSHPSVKYASVALRRNEVGGDSYVAYVEGAHEAPVPAQLRAYLEMNVPRYMVPREFVCRASTEGSL